MCSCERLIRPKQRPNTLHKKIDVHVEVIPRLLKASFPTIANSNDADIRTRFELSCLNSNAILLQAKIIESSTYTGISFNERSLLLLLLTPLRFKRLYYQQYCMAASIVYNTQTILSVAGKCRRRCSSLRPMQGVVHLFQFEGNHFVLLLLH